MLLPRIALLLALIPGVFFLYLGIAGHTSKQHFSRLAAESELTALDPAASGAGVLAEVAARHRIWAVELRDRSGFLLADWQRLPLARSGLFGSPLELRQPATGALVRWWVAPARATTITFSAGSLAWILLMLFANRRLGRLPPNAARGWSEPTLPVPDPGEPLRPKLRAALDSAPCAIITATRSGQVRHANPLMLDWLGRTRLQVRGRDVRDVLPLYANNAEVPSCPWEPGGEPPQHGDPVRWELRANNAVRNVALAWSRGVDGSLLVGLFDTSAVESSRQSTLYRLDLMQHILDVLPAGVLVTDASGRIQMANRNAERQFAWGPGELEGEELTKLMPVPFLNQPDIGLEDYRGQSSQRGGPLPKVVGWRKDATTFPVGLTVEDLSDDSGGFLVLIEDMTEAMQTAAAQSRLGRLFEQTAEEVLILDARSLYVREANRGAQENLGYSLQQLRRMTLFHLAPGLDSGPTEPQVARLRAGEQRELRLNTSFCREDGSSYPVRLSLTCSREEEPPVLMLLAHDVTAQRAAENRLAWMSGHDTLTRLPNRSAAMEELARQESEGVAGVLCMLSIDRLGAVNLQVGHDQGDELIATLAERLQDAFPEARLIARWSGATFVLLLAEAPAEPAELLAALGDPVELASGTVTPQLLLGMARLGRRAEQSLRDAIGAVEQARATGGWFLKE